MTYRTPELQLIGAAANLVLEASIAEKAVAKQAGCESVLDEMNDPEFYSLSGNW